MISRLQSPETRAFEVSVHPLLLLHLDSLSLHPIHQSTRSRPSPNTHLRLRFEVDVGFAKSHNTLGATSLSIANRLPGDNIQSDIPTEADRGPPWCIFSTAASPSHLSLHATVPQRHHTAPSTRAHPHFHTHALRSANTTCFRPNWHSDSAPPRHFDLR